MKTSNTSNSTDRLMNDHIIIILLAIVFAVLVITIMRRDTICGMFTLALMVYTLPSLIGYRYFPFLSEVLGSFFGRQLFYKALTFIALSLVAYGVAFTALYQFLIGPKRYRLTVQVSEPRRGLGLAIITILTVWMALTLPGIYARIDYGSSPQIPSFAYAFAFKSLPPIIVLLVSFGVNHAKTTFERMATWILSASLIGLFLVTAIKSSNRTDILALTLGLAWIAIGPLFVDKEWRVNLNLDARSIRRASIVISLIILSFAVMYSIAGKRDYNPGVPIPLYARVLFNDYYVPAHILFAAIQFEYIEPLLVVKSNLANALLIGGVLDVPYLQTEIGNRLVAGSSTRSTGFAMHIFAEGFMALGNLGFLYNGIMPVLMFALWRRLARSDNLQYNTLVAALSLMFMATVVRSGNYLTFRLYLFNLMPLLGLYRFIAGIRLT